MTITPLSQLLSYGVTGQSPTNYFYQLTGYSYLQTSIYSPSNQAIPANFQTRLDDLRFDPVAGFPDFNTSGNLLSAFSFDLSNLICGETVILDITLTSAYDGQSFGGAPAPPLCPFLLPCGYSVAGWRASCSCGGGSITDPKPGYMTVTG